MIRLLILFSILISQASFAQERAAKARLAPQTLRFDALVGIQLNSLKEYLRDLREQRRNEIDPKDAEKPDRIIFYDGSSSSQVRFSARLETVINGDERTDSLLFQSYGNPAGRIHFRRVGKDLKPMELQDAFRGKFPTTEGCTEYEVNWVPFKFKAYFRTDGEVSTNRLSFYDDLVIIENDEIALEQKSIVRTRLLYRGKQQGPELEAANLLSDKGVMEVHGYFKPDLKERDLREFATAYAQMVTGPMNSFVFGLFYEQVTKLHWPLPQGISFPIGTPR